MNFFMVFQNKSFQKEFQQGVLWAPSKDSSGGPAKFHWKSLLECKPKDIVFSVVKNQIVARGIVQSSAIEVVNPLESPLWGRDGFQVKVDYSMCENPVRLQEILGEIRGLLPEKYSPINPNSGRGNEGYLFPINPQLGKLLDEKIVDVFAPASPTDIFTISEDESNMIHEVFEEAGLEEGKVILIEEDAPSGSNRPKIRVSRRYGKKTDYAKKAEQDQKKGFFAESLVLDFEKQELIKIGRPDLAEKVEPVSQESDGYGFDIRSFTPEGIEKFIEVKGTPLMKTTPFFVTKNEVETSERLSDNYWIYRVYYLEDENPHFFRIRGKIKTNFDLEPSEFIAYFR